MNKINTIDNEQQTLPTELDHLFAQLAPQDVEQFYQSYRLWSLQHDIATVQAQISETEQLIEHNAQLMQSVQPSPIALSALTQLQAYGVGNIDLLERMLERGDGWLDHTVQLLVRCEELGVIRSDYAQWCENALEGAYDWIWSMDQATTTPEISEPFDDNIESALLQKLMSEDDTEPRLPIVKADSTDIVDQATLLPANSAKSAPSKASAQPSIATIDQLEISREEVPVESAIIAAPDSSYGTTEAINLEDLKVPVTTLEEDSDANPSSINSDQLTGEIHLMDASSELHTTTTETLESGTIKQRIDTIYSFRDSSTNISHDRNIPSKALIAIDNNTLATTTLTANSTEQTIQQKNDAEEQAAIIATNTVVNTVTARTVKTPEMPAEQTEPTTDHTITKVQLQEDDLALPPVTNTYKPRISWSEPVATAIAERPKQTLQATNTPHKPGISWSDERIEPRQVPQKKQHGLLARLFRSPRSKSKAQ